MVEQRSEEPRVVSSILSLGTKKPSRKRWFFDLIIQPAKLYSLLMSTHMERSKRPTHEIIANELESKPESSEIAVSIMAMIANLEDVTLTTKQKAAASTIGGAINVYDSAYDKYDIHHSRSKADSIQAKLNNEAVDERALGSRLNKAVELAQDTFSQEALGALQDLSLAQRDSLLQREDNPDIHLVEEITRRKGGNTVLLFALEVNPSMDERRKACYLELGYLVQLLDDFQDRTLDKNDRIHTLATDLESVEFSHIVESQVSKVRSVFMSEFKETKLTILFQYIDKMLAASGISR